MPESIAERLVRLESNLAHLERLYEQLNEVVVEQGKLVSRLKTQQQQVIAALETAEVERIKARNPKPPHYQ